MVDKRTQQEKLHEKHGVNPRTITTPRKRFSFLHSIIRTIGDWF